VTRTRVATPEDAAIARIHDEGIADRIATFETEPRTAEEVTRGRRERAPRWPTVFVERDGERPDTVIVERLIGAAARE
jgi:L-amino acid N-acyltransferase YncA